MWLREHGRVYSAGSPVDTGEIALYKNYSLLSLLLLLLLLLLLHPTLDPFVHLPIQEREQVIQLSPQVGGPLTEDTVRGD